MSEMYTVYRRGFAADASMDWAVHTNEDGIIVRMGPTCRPAPYTVVPAATCIDDDPEKEAAVRTEEKLKAGFRPVGYGVYERGRLVLRAGQGADELEAELYWEAHTAFPPKAFVEAVNVMVGRLARNHVSAALSTRSDENGTALTGLMVHTPDGPWNIGFQKHGGLDSTGRGGGFIDRAQGAVPILVLMSLAQTFPGTLAFADQNGNAVEPALASADPWLGSVAAPFEATVALAAALGLCPGALPMLTDPGDEPAMWF